MEFNYFLSRITFFVIGILVLWGITKFLKFKRNKIEYAFLVTAIMFVFSSVLEIILIYVIGISILSLLVFVLISGIFGLFLWFYLIEHVYKISPKQAFKVWLIGFIIMLIISSLVLFLFPYQSPYSIIQKDLSCGELYNSFPLSKLSEGERLEGLQRCLTNQAINEDNINICETTSSPNSCYSEYARTKLDESLCLNLEENSKYFCYYSIARDKNDDSICENLPIESHFGDIYTCKFNVNVDLAVLRNDIDYCNPIDIEWRKDICYIKFARAKLDENLCNNVEGYLNSKESCIESIKRWKEVLDDGNKLPEYYWAG